MTISGSFYHWMLFGGLFGFAFGFAQEMYKDLRELREKRRMLRAFRSQMMSPTATGVPRNVIRPFDHEDDAA